MKLGRMFKIYHHQSIWILMIISIYNALISNADGCSCIYKELQDSFDESENAIVGKVTKVTPARSQEEPTVAEFSVSHSLKGNASQTIFIATRENSAMCGYTMTEGDEYLLFAYSPGHIENSPDYYFTSLCMRNTNLSKEIWESNHSGPAMNITRPRINRDQWRKWVPEKVRIIFDAWGYLPTTSNWNMSVTYGAGTPANPHTIVYSFDLVPETNVSLKEYTYGTSIYQNLPGRNGVYQISLQPRCPESVVNDSACFKGIIDTVIVSGLVDINTDSHKNGQKNIKLSRFLSDQSGLLNANIVLTDLKGRRFEFIGLHAANNEIMPEGCYMRQIVEKNTGKVLFSDKIIILR